MEHNQEQRQRGALERRQRDVEKYTELLKQDVHPDLRQLRQGLLKTAQWDVANLKRKLGVE